MSNLADRKALTHDGTIAIATAAVAEAKRNGWNVTIAIVDAGGHPLHLQRLDGAGPGTAAAAVSKARTSALYGFETKGFEGMVKDGRTGILNLPDSLPLEGGLPITVVPCAAISRKRDVPKSLTLSMPVSETSMLPGRMSRCRMPARWA